MDAPENDLNSDETEKQNNLNCTNVISSSQSSNGVSEHKTSAELTKFQSSYSKNIVSPQSESSDVTEVSDDGETPSIVSNSLLDFSDEKRDVEKPDVEEEQSSQPRDAPQNTDILERPPDPRIPPKVDCPEKIVFCIDISSDMNDPPFKLGNGALFSPLCMIKRVIDIFVHNKLRIDHKHEFAVMGFHETAVWFRDFTNDVKELNAAMDKITEMRPCKESGLSSVFSLLSLMASDLPSFSSPEVVPPPFILRVILVYGRSNCIPDDILNSDVLAMLKSSPYFYLDILYVHETPSPDNKCQEIFERLCDLDNNEASYIFEVSRNTTKLHNCMAKLLAHPLQRPLQKYAKYKFLNIVPQEN